MEPTIREDDSDVSIGSDARGCGKEGVEMAEKDETAGVRKRKEEEDVEGHVRMRKSDADDTEGHVRMRKSDADDTEGHAGTEEEDVEGHKTHRK
jgi:hypothetical protein